MMMLQVTEMPVVMAGGGFPWGLLIIGGILYLLWRNGMFDGRGRHGRGGPYGGYGPGYGPPQFPEGRGPEQGQGQGPSQGQGQGGSFFRGPQEYFDEWHRQAHADAQPQPQAPVAPAAPVTPAQPAAPAPAPEAPASGNGETVR